MPTAKPRITVTLDERAHEVLSRLSVASGDSMSQIVAGFVDLAVPSLERVVVVLERAKSAPKEARDGLAAAIDRAERQLLPALVNSQDQVDLFLADSMQGLRVLPEERLRPPAAPGRAVRPPPSNTGVRSSSKRRGRG